MDIVIYLIYLVNFYAVKASDSSPYHPSSLLVFNEVSVLTEPPELLGSVTEAVDSSLEVIKEVSIEITSNQQENVTANLPIEQHDRLIVGNQDAAQDNYEELLDILRLDIGKNAIIASIFHFEFFEPPFQKVRKLLALIIFNLCQVCRISHKKFRQNQTGRL
jgi:hypothetical protein